MWQFRRLRNLVLSEIIEPALTTWSSVGEKQYLEFISLEDFHWNCPSCMLSELPFTNASIASSNFHHSLESISLNTSSTSTDSISITATPIRNNNSFNCTVLNARSIGNKRIDLHALLISKQIDILAVTETFLNEDVLESELSSSIHRHDRNRHGVVSSL